MNAILTLCHFCEAHGPRSLFCTFTTDNDEHITEPSKASVQCTGCASLGPETVLKSTDDDGTIYCSRESVPSADVTSFLRQAAIRSITCEVNWSKDGGIVYFSEAQGHVLSFTFQLCDTRARGLKRWFSILVLMKDKMLLLNITPMLSEHMKNIAAELQKLAVAVFDEEQKICSQRALRLRTGRNDFGQSRSLVQLTGNKEIFKLLHSHFSWILKAGARVFSENLYTSQDLLKKISPIIPILESNSSVIESKAKYIPMRVLESMLSNNVFRVMLFCTLTGVNIQMQTNFRDPEEILISFRSLLPEFDSSAKHKKPNTDPCIISEIEHGNFISKWMQTLPVNCPTLMKKIEIAIKNEHFNEAVLRQHVLSLVLQWQGIAQAVKSTMKSSDNKTDSVKLKQILGVAQYDETLLKYWMDAFCK